MRQIKKLLEELDVRKPMGSDKVSGWILKECREHGEPNLGCNQQFFEGKKSTKGMEKGKYNTNIQWE